jgi:hypothetical protein
VGDILSAGEVLDVREDGRVLELYQGGRDPVLVYWEVEADGGTLARVLIQDGGRFLGAVEVRARGVAVRHAESLPGVAGPLPDPAGRLAALIRIARAGVDLADGDGAIARLEAIIRIAAGEA